MTRPQQQEIARSGRTDVDPDAAASKATNHGDVDPPIGKVPPGNEPGHHPDREQDKPEALGGAGHGTGRD